MYLAERQMKIRFIPLLRWLVLLLGAALPAILVGCSGGSAPLAPTSSLPRDTLKIGVILPLTGTNARLGQRLQQGIDLAVELEGGQVAGRPIKLIVEDEGDRDSAVALDKVKKLVESDRVDLMLGPVQSGVASAVLSYTSSVPLIDVKFTAPLSNDETHYDFTFWTAPRFQDYGYPLGIFAAEKGFKTVVSIGSDSPEATGYTEGFVLGFQNLGGTLIQQQWIPITSSEYTSQIAELRTADATISALLGETARDTFLKEYEAQDLPKDVPLILLEPNSLTPDTIRAMNEDFTGTLGIQGYSTSLNNPENQKFVGAYQAEFKTLPDKAICEAYNGMKVVLEALKNTQGDASAAVLKPALAKVQMDLPTGPFKFSQSRTGLEPLRVYSIQNINGVLQWVIQKEYPAAEFYHAPGM
jgi:branched-chain amino acid transport system substrate-binding protein